MIAVEFSRNTNQFFIRSIATASGKTGVEMEAFVAAEIAALTIYDMIKAQDPKASIGPFSLVRKEGGKSSL